jgi:hypothetical protein
VLYFNQVQLLSPQPKSRLLKKYPLPITATLINLDLDGAMGRNPQKLELLAKLVDAKIPHYQKMGS